MQLVSDSKLEETYTVFCEHMGMNSDKWISIIEFTHFAGFRILNVARDDVRTKSEMLISDNSARTVNLLHGPHASTVVRAYKHRRYSFIGRVRAAGMLPLIVIGFIGVVLVAIAKEFWDGW